jgi:hypothetical protein
LPKKLRASYEQAMNDPALLSLEDEAAVLQALAYQAAEQMKQDHGQTPSWDTVRTAYLALERALDGGDGDVIRACIDQLRQVVVEGADASARYEQAKQELLELIDAKVKVASGEWRRLNLLEQFIPIPHAVMMIKSLLETFRDAVMDKSLSPKERLYKVQQQANQVMGGSRPAPPPSDEG